MRRRRTRRRCAVTALAAHGGTLLQAWLWLIVFIFQNEFRISDSIQPGYLDFDNLPDTNFTCAGKVIGGYYADLETSCQMFHVCTVGQGDEPMDIKFLCLNGTVFDQETRVCERVDEVDCTKSEKFYSLNLELYGSTAAPAIEPEHASPGSQEEQADKAGKTEPSTSVQSDPTPQSDLTKIGHHTAHVEPIEENMEPVEEQQEEEEEEYVDYTENPAPPSTTPPPTTIRATTTTTTTTHSPAPSSTSAPQPYGVQADPSLLSPHEFTFQHRPAPAPSPPVSALSFQRQSYPQHAQPPRLTLTAHRSSTPPPPAPPRPADHVYITAAPQPQHHFSELEQIDHYELYESNKNNPRRPVQFQPPRTPQGFRPNNNVATASPPRSQLASPGQYDSRPIQSYQPSERHEILYDDRFRPLPPHPTFDYSRFHFDRKRSHETEPSESSESSEARPPPLARSVSSTPSSIASISSTSGRVSSERSFQKSVPKSPPRVIVTASASVSDSNGKKLNYTVGNVVSAVKPIVPINYDDYKESDLIFDPFFLDVPKLKRRHKTTGKRSAAVIMLPKQASPLAEPPKRVTTARPWIPPDYVDDNYEPETFAEAPPPEPENYKLKEKMSALKDPEKVVSSQTEGNLRIKLSADRRQTSKVGFEMERLLAALPPPGGGEFHVVNVGHSSTKFSCEGVPVYRTMSDSRDCRAFHVCAGVNLHVQLKCSPGLHFDAKTGTCATPSNHQKPCVTRPDNV